MTLTWRSVDDSERKRKECVRMERLWTESGEALGSVMQFNGDGVAYATSQFARLGPAPTFDEAKAVVERAVIAR